VEVSFRKTPERLKEKIGVVKDMKRQGSDQFLADAQGMRESGNGTQKGTTCLGGIWNQGGRRKKGSENKKSGHEGV